MRERLSLDRNWRFALGHAASPANDFEFARDRSLVKAGEARGAASKDFNDSQWRQVDLPHDWAIELPFDPTGDKELAEHGFRAIGPDHPQNSVGWYRRRFKIPASDLGRRIRVIFDGVFRDSVVWINGHRLGRHASGYTSFHYDLTDLLNYGGENVLAVRVDATNWEGWWYEGAGIYRHVWLLKTHPVHLAMNGTFAVCRVRKSEAIVQARTQLVNEAFEPVRVRLMSRVVAQDGTVVAMKRSPAISLATGQEIEMRPEIRIRQPALWSCETPNLYQLQSELWIGRKQVDVKQISFGIRTLGWDARRGFSLNGRRLKIKGTCNHQQHAGVGTALPDRLGEWRLQRLKELGSNAYRCSHYAATPELLDACDRLGILVVAENRLAGTSPEVLGQLRSMIERDRNHPSIILWSLANEEHTVQWSTAGERIGRTMVALAHRLDPTRKVTSAMHDRGLNEGFANIVDVHGWNYMNVGDLQAFHRRRPTQPIVGTEEGSTVCTRGEYADDKVRGYLSAYDARAPKWGSTAEKWWRFFAERDWLAGAFVWTGFDYYGEPIPYQWPCTASHFGLMDLCGFPKDIYYYYQSWWSDRPVLHLFPHWNWAGKEGQLIDVRCFSNCDDVELFLNGRNLGRQRMVRNSHLAWKVPYEPGVLEVNGYRAGKRIAHARRQTAGKPASIRISCDRPFLRADGEDVAVIAVSALDEAGLAAPTANNPIQFAIEGPGRLIGVGNGDPSSHESDKAPFRRLFNGKAMALVQSLRGTGSIVVRATSAGCEGDTLQLKARRSPRRLEVD